VNSDRGHERRFTDMEGRQSAVVEAEKRHACRRWEMEEYGIVFGINLTWTDGTFFYVSLPSSDVIFYPLCRRELLLGSNQHSGTAPLLTWSDMIPGQSPSKTATSVDSTPTTRPPKLLTSFWVKRSNSNVCVQLHCNARFRPSGPTKTPTIDRA
jgi:hypothetical protein